MDLQLNQKVALVSGGSSGIGKAIVHRLLEEGCRVVNVSLEPPADHREWEECRFIQADLCSPEQCKSTVEKVLDIYSSLDILVNNAGVNDSIGLQATPSQFLTSLQRNVVHYFSLMHYSLEALRESQGAVVNIGSKVSVTGQGGTSGYAAAKGGVNSLTREWALELAEEGVRVNAVIPAEVLTPQYEQWLADQTCSAAMQSRIALSVPLQRRYTRPEEIADMVGYLASSRASHITGQLIFVDGGYTHLDRRATVQSKPQQA
ncbi:L-fucose dehydrogenase [Sansalvadorimonas verongulae]|uniref:SDR family oxidoreductase n=1 Tax=Sansalvadorimonas verongulae TaxID=2172824 RepID=UPI002E30B6E2|nr:SDR family oxidoreductase [Sansalvadorimonas verongulae]MTI12765.1 SDR family oxidoreductase [Sansalvadorimonas verongulae]